MLRGKPGTVSPRRKNMKQSSTNQVPPALNRGGVTGAPITSGNSNEKSIAAAKSFADDLRRRANYPLRKPDGYDKAIAACMRKAARDARRKPSRYKLSLFEWNPRLRAAIVLLLLVLIIVLWAGCRVRNAAISAVGNHPTAISRALPE